MQKPEHGIRLRSSARTSTGQVRQNNEDNIHLWAGEGFVLAIIADGMGGAAAGEEASRIAVETIKAGFKPDAADDTPITEQLQDTIHTANLNIVRKAAASPEMRGMGTTLTLAFIRGTYATFAHVGDSRAYLVEPDDETITQITIDHSYVQALVMAGHITPEQAETHSMGNVLYRALGQNEDVDVDIYYKRLHIGDRLILCSDGLTRHVKAAELAKMAFSDPNPDVVSQKMIDLANQRGGEDNISVIIIAVEGELMPYSDEEETDLSKPFHDEDDRDSTIILKNNPLKRARETLEIASADPHDTLRLPKLKADEWLEQGSLTSITEADLLPDEPTEPVEPVTDESVVKTPSLPVPNANRDGTDEGRDMLTPDQ